MTIAEVIRRNSAPLEPQPTGMSPRLPVLDGIKAVLFDIYGTLFISASGDISLSSGASRGGAAEEALQAAGLVVTNCPGDQVVAALHAEIERQHQASPVEFPEVDIHDVWRNTLEALLELGHVDHTPNAPQLARLAVEYECRVNPVWPMPGLVEVLASAREAGLAMGVVSNAQSFTRELFPAFTESTSAELGFAQDLCAWSYEHRQAKPGVYLYKQVVTALAERGVRPDEVLYAGNDMRNDVAPAAAVGFRTALFAGDNRSLRLREGDPMTDGVEPDGVVTDLPQILAILRLAPNPE